MPAYYNEHDPYCAAWLRNLIAAGHIAPGEVDERSIVDVRPLDVRGFDQCHFFAGIGVWSYALRRAGWPDDRPVWTGSCPCQPFSAAGKGGGFDDERHLWPAFFHLIGECRPPIVLGEQVASRDGLNWLDLVQDDMEGADYAFGAVDTCSAGHGAPHIRQRLRWVADTTYQQHDRPRYGGAGGRDEYPDRGATCFLADGSGPRLEGRDDRSLGDECATAERGGGPGGMADAHGRNASAERLQRGGEYGQQSQDANPCDRPERPGPTNGFWRDADWLFCRDGKWRPVEPSIFPLVDGVAFRMGSDGPFEGKSRIGMLKGAGNAVDAEATEAFIRALS